MTTYDELEGIEPTQAQLAFEEAINDIYGVEIAAAILAADYEF